MHSPNKYFWWVEKTVNFEKAYRALPKVDFHPLAKYHGATLMELRGVDPLAFVTGRPEHPLSFRLTCRGADIDIAGLSPGTAVTINFMYYPQINCTQNGQTLAAAADDWQCITDDIGRGRAGIVSPFPTTLVQNMRNRSRLVCRCHGDGLAVPQGSRIVTFGGQCPKLALSRSRVALPPSLIESNPRLRRVPR